MRKALFAFALAALVCFASAAITVSYPADGQTYRTNNGVLDLRFSVPPWPGSSDSVPSHCTYALDDGKPADEFAVLVSSSGVDVYKPKSLQGLTAGYHTLTVACMRDPQGLDNFLFSIPFLGPTLVKRDSVSGSSTFNHVAIAGACVDSDGDSPFTLGTCTEGSTSTVSQDVVRTDYCIDNMTVNEFVCGAQNTCEARSEPCRNGCLNGVCVAQATAPQTKWTTLHVPKAGASAATPAPSTENVQLATGESFDFHGHSFNLYSQAPGEAWLRDETNSSVKLTAGGADGVFIYSGEEVRVALLSQAGSGLDLVSSFEFTYTSEGAGGAGSSTTDVTLGLTIFAPVEGATYGSRTIALQYQLHDASTESARPAAEGKISFAGLNSASFVAAPPSWCVQPSNPEQSPHCDQTICAEEGDYFHCCGPGTIAPSPWATCGYPYSAGCEGNGFCYVCRGTNEQCNAVPSPTPQAPSPTPEPSPQASPRPTTAPPVTPWVCSYSVDGGSLSPERQVTLGVTVADSFTVANYGRHNVQVFCRPVQNFLGADAPEWPVDSLVINFTVAAPEFSVTLYEPENKTYFADAVPWRFEIDRAFGESPSAQPADFYYCEGKLDALDWAKLNYSASESGASDLFPDGVNVTGSFNLTGAYGPHSAQVRCASTKQPNWGYSNQVNFTTREPDVPAVIYPENKTYWTNALDFAFVVAGNYANYACSYELDGVKKDLPANSYPGGAVLWFNALLSPLSPGQHDVSVTCQGIGARQPKTSAQVYFTTFEPGKPVIFSPKNDSRFEFDANCTNYAAVPVSYAVGGVGIEDSKKLYFALYEALKALRGSDFVEFEPVVADCGSTVGFDERSPSGDYYACANGANITVMDAQLFGRVVLETAGIAKNASDANVQTLRLRAWKDGVLLEEKTVNAGDSALLGGVIAVNFRSTVLLPTGGAVNGSVFVDLGAVYRTAGEPSFPVAPNMKTKSVKSLLGGPWQVKQTYSCYYQLNGSRTALGTIDGEIDPYFVLGLPAGAYQLNVTCALEAGDVPTQPYTSDTLSFTVSEAPGAVKSVQISSPLAQTYAGVSALDLSFLVTGSYNNYGCSRSLNGSSVELGTVHGGVLTTFANNLTGLQAGSGYLAEVTCFGWCDILQQYSNSSNGSSVYFDVIAPVTQPVCGNGVCEAGETAESCPQDCGGGTGYCGDGICQSGESQATCPSDCGSTPGGSGGSGGGGTNYGSYNPYYGTGWGSGTLGTGGASNNGTGVIPTLYAPSVRPTATGQHGDTYLSVNCPRVVVNGTNNFDAYLSVAGAATCDDAMTVTVSINGSAVPGAGRLLSCGSGSHKLSFDATAWGDYLVVVSSPAYGLSGQCAFKDAGAGGTELPDLSLAAVLFALLAAGYAISRKR